MTEEFASFTDQFPLVDPADGDPGTVPFNDYLKQLLRIAGYDDSVVYENVAVPFDELGIEPRHGEYESPFTCPIYVAEDVDSQPHLAGMGYDAVKRAPLNLSEYAEFREAVTVLYDVVKPNLTVALTPFDVWVRGGPSMRSFSLVEDDPSVEEELLDALAPPEKLARRG